MSSRMSTKLYIISRGRWRDTVESGMAKLLVWGLHLLIIT